VGKSKLFYGYIIVAAGFLIMTVMWGTYYSFGIFFEPVLKEFGWTRAATAGAFSLSLVLTGFFAIVMGRLNDRFGPRKVITACALLLGAGYILMSQISALWELYLFYGLILGIGLGGAFVPVASTISRWFIRRRSLMTGITASGIGVGTFLMPPIANWLISSYGWRTSYIIIGAAAVVLIIIVIAMFTPSLSVSIAIMISTLTIWPLGPGDIMPSSQIFTLKDFGE